MDGPPKNFEFKCNLNCLFSKALRVFILIARLIILCCAHTHGNSIKGSFILGWREGDIPYRFDVITFRISISKLGMLYFQSSTPITRNRPSKANSLMCSISTQVHPRTRHVVRKIILFICIQTSLNGDLRRSESSISIHIGRMLLQ